MVDATNANTVTFDLLDNGTSVLNFPITVNGQNVDINVKPVYWEDAVDVSLSGQKRSNIRAYDLTLDVNFNANLEATKIEDVFRSLMALLSPAFELRVSLDSNQWFKVIPTDSVNILIQFRDTVRTGGGSAIIPTLTFEADKYFYDLGDFLTII